MTMLGADPGGTAASPGGGGDPPSCRAAGRRSRRRHRASTAKAPPRITASDSRKRSQPPRSMARTALAAPCDRSSGRSRVASITAHRWARICVIQISKSSSISVISGGPSSGGPAAASAARMSGSARRLRRSSTLRDRSGDTDGVSPGGPASAGITGGGPSAACAGVAPGTPCAGAAGTAGPWACTPPPQTSSSSSAAARIRPRASRNIPAIADPPPPPRPASISHLASRILITGSCAPRQHPLRRPARRRRARGADNADAAAGAPGLPPLRTGMSDGPGGDQPHPRPSGSRCAQPRPPQEARRGAAASRPARPISAGILPARIRVATLPNPRENRRAA